MPAGFQQIVETDDIALDVHIRVINAIAHACLCRQVHHNVEVILSKQLIHQRLITNGALYEHMPDRTTYRRLLHQAKAVLLQCRVIVVVHIVKADHCAR